MRIERKTVILCAAVLILGTAVALFFFFRPSPSVEKTERAVDQNIEDLKNQVSKLSETVEVLTSQAERKVVISREEVRSEVVHLSPDAVCAALNDELHSFRRICTDPQRPDGNGD